MTTNIEQTQATELGRLPFGAGKIGREALLDKTDSADFAQQLGIHTGELTQHNLADCIDGRTILYFVKTPSGLVLAERRVPQLPGGTFLAATKAATSAGAQVVSDAKDMWDAFIKVASVLTTAGEEDTGHEDCGADKNVEDSVARAIELDALIDTGRLLLGDDARSLSTLRSLQIGKRQLLLKGFYSRWDPARHKEYVTDDFPQNFAYLNTDDTHETRGHLEEGIYIIGEDGKGFAKNNFVNDTGRQAFAVTVPKMRQLAHILGASEEERHRIFVAFIDDVLHVSNGLVAEGMPVFAGSRES